MNCSGSSTIIGVLGTIIGTLIGFFLQRIPRIGKIKIFQNVLTFQLFESDRFGGYVAVTSLSPGENGFYSQIDLWCDFFNTSESSNKIARGIHLECQSRHETFDKTIFIYEVENKYAGSEHAGILPTLNNLVLAPKQLINYHLLVTFHDKILDIKKYDLTIKYKDARDKVHSIKIDKKKLPHI